MIKKSRFFVVYALLIAVGLFVYLHGDVAVPVSRPLAEIPQQYGGWRMVGETQFDDQVIAVLKPSDYLARSYVNEEGQRIGLYLGYHGGGPESGPIHSPKHCLPGSGWQEVSTRAGTLEVAGEKINLVRAVYQSGYSHELFLYWFQVRGQTLASEYILKLTEVTNSILYNRRDSAFIRLAVPVQDDMEQALALGEGFIQDFYPHIKAVLPR